MARDFQAQGIEHGNSWAMREVMPSGTCEKHSVAQLQGVVGDEAGHVGRNQMLQNF